MKKIAIVLLFVALSSLAPFASAQVSSPQSEKARSFVTNAGTGRDAKVEVELRDKRKFKGYIGSSSANDFTVIDEKTGRHVVAFDDVEKIKKPRTGLKPRTWVIIGAAAAAAIIVGKTVLYPVLCDGGAGC